jgi:hypothetical protein
MPLADDTTAITVRNKQGDAPVLTLAPNADS